MKEQKGYDSSFTFKIHRKCKYQFILKKLTFKGYRFNLSPLYTAMIDNRTIILFLVKPQPKKNQKSKKRSKYIHQSSYRTKRGQYRKTFHSKKRKKREKEEEEKKNNEPFNRIGESAKGIEKREAKNMVDKETWSAKDHGITWHGVSGKRSSRE